MDSRAYAVQLQKHIATEMMLSQAIRESSESPHGDAVTVPEVMATFFRAIREAESSVDEAAG
eukprot:14380187-Alexandrium_andersonii.AAC.1